MKKTFTKFFFSFFLFLVAQNAFAATIDVSTGTPTVRSIDQLLSSTQGYMNMVAGTIAVVFVLIGATLYIISSFGKLELAQLGKKIIIVTCLGFAAVVAAPTIYKEIVNITGGNAASIASASPMAKIISNVVTGFLTFVGFYAIMGFLFGGFTMFFAAGDQQRMERGKKIVRYSIIGTVIVVGALIIVRTIINLFLGK